jgi:hypothetical protein
MGLADKHEAPLVFLFRSHNDGCENTRLQWRGRNIGDSPLCPRGGEVKCVFLERSGALGQSRQSPMFGWGAKHWGQPALSTRRRSEVRFP